MTHSPRNIRFKEIRSMDEWRVKCYTISKNDVFTATKGYDSAIDSLNSWLSEENSFNSTHCHHAFYICHEASEGVFHVLNWWVGTNMLNMQIYFSDYSDLKKFRKISGDGLGPCIWELEVIDFERRAYIDHYLKKDIHPAFEEYLNMTLNTRI